MLSVTLNLSFTWFISVDVSSKKSYPISWHLIGLPVCSNPTSEIPLQPFISDFPKKVYQIFSIILIPFFHNNRLQFEPVLQYILNCKPLWNLSENYDISQNGIIIDDDKSSLESDDKTSTC